MHPDSPRTDGPPDRPTSLRHARYDRSNGYDEAWVAENQMGPNALWLTESLCEVLPIEPGMKVLDLGCGKAVSSIFLAKEFGARVWATDLWIGAGENQTRVVEAGVDDLVTPIHAEAHTLPFAADFFDVVTSLDAYQYFGTDDLYLGYLVDFVKSGGRLGAVVPALTSEVGDSVPAVLEPFWESEFCCFHSPAWWRTHWAKSRKVTVEHADLVPDGWRDWLHFNDYLAPFVEGWWVEEIANTHDMLVADEGRNIGFTRIVAAKP
ncbi:MAG: SAM-dependent methyltransferase [Acidimicrobiales bacterium]